LIYVFENRNYVFCYFQSVLFGGKLIPFTREVPTLGRLPSSIGKFVQLRNSEATVTRKKIVTNNLGVYTVCTASC